MDSREIAIDLNAPGMYATLLASRVMNSPRSHEPPLAAEPLTQALDRVEESSQGIGLEDTVVVAHPQVGGAEVIPTGNFPQSRPATDLSPPRAARPPQAQGSVPTRASVSSDDTEIISAIPDPSASRRRRTRNRKALSPLKLLSTFVAAQAVLGLLFFALFGGIVRGWLQDSAVPSDGVTAKDAAALRDEVRAADARFGALGEDVEHMKKQLSVKPGDAWEQLDLLGERNNLTLLADDAITNGNRLAFDQLLERAKDISSDKRLRDGAAAEISRVRIYYSSITRLGSYALPVVSLYPSLKSAAEEALSPSQLVRLLGDESKDWRVRCRAAYLLGNKRSLAVSGALARAAKEDPNLDVVKECVVSFEQNTGFRSKGMFEIDALSSFWRSYESRVSAAAEQMPSSSGM